MENRTITKHPKHSHFFIDSGDLFEAYNTIRGLRHSFIMAVDGWADKDTVSDEDIELIEMENCSKKEYPKKKIYISGKITGIEDDAGRIFENAENYLIDLDYEVLNPLKINHQHDKSWHSYMKEDIKALCDCDEIFMLYNWTDSKGAIIEHTIAMYLGLKVKYQNI